MTITNPDVARARQPSIDLLWLSLALFILLILVMLLPVTPYDYWWYLRLGQDVVNTGSVPLVNTYSYTQLGVPYFYQPWLVGVIFWKVYEAGGLTLTFFLRALIIALTYGLLWFLAREAGAGPRLASLLVLWSALAGSGNWAFRPQLFTYPLFVLALFALVRWDRGAKKELWLLPLLSMLWVNLHGSFPLLFVVGLFAFLFGRGDKKQLALWLGLSAAALLINPHGINIFGYVLKMLRSSSVQQYSNEWLPAVNRGWQANLFFFWLLVMAPLVALSPRKLSLFEWLLFLFFGWMALSGVRYVIWFLFILAFITARLLGDWAGRFIEGKAQIEKPHVNMAAAGLLLLLPLALLPGLRESWWKDAPRPYDGDNPVQATTWLAAHPELQGPLWSDFSHASYLIFALPSRPVWIDTRFELYPPEQWQEYIAVETAAPNWKELLDKEGIQLAMLSTHAQPALITAMQQSGAWCEQYHDEDAVIFSRRGAAACP